MAAGRLSFTDLQNPLFLHPSDGPTSISVSKLQGASDYRAWRRSFEIQVSAKRKMGFLDGTISRNVTDAVEATQWDTNGPRKYKLNKDLFSLKQGGGKISDYYTSLSGLWEEIESMNLLPTITTVTPEITSLLEAIEKMKAESRLFQFLNGLDDIYSAQRSQLLMMSPLPSVEIACAAVLGPE